MRLALILIVWLAALVCAGSWAAGEVRSLRDRSVVTTMTNTAGTVCTGPSLVDLPSQAEVGYSGAVEESEAKFLERVAGRGLEIKTPQPDPTTWTIAPGIRVRKINPGVRSSLRANSPAAD